MNEERPSTSLQHAPTHCNTPQHTATHCNTKEKIVDTQEKKRHGIIQQTRCAEPCVECGSRMERGILRLCLLTGYNTLQRTTTHGNTLQHPSTHTSCEKGYFEHTATYCNPSLRATLQKKHRHRQTKESINDRGQRSKAAHNMCEEPCLARGCLVR